MHALTLEIDMRKLLLSRLARAARFALLAIALVACGGGGDGQGPRHAAANETPPAPPRARPAVPRRHRHRSRQREGGHGRPRARPRDHRALHLHRLRDLLRPHEGLEPARGRDPGGPAGRADRGRGVSTTRRSTRPRAGSGFRSTATREASSLAKHEMDIYPTAVMVRPDGTILFVRRGVTPLFTPDRAVNMIRHVEREN